MITRTIKDTRTLTFELSPPVLYELGLQAAIEWLAESIQGQSGLAIQVEEEHGNDRLDSGRRVFLFRAVRELLFNVVKHAGANRVDIRIVNGVDRIKIELIDDGRGCELSPIASQKANQDSGFGLFSIREQLRHYGGKLIFETGREQGSCVIISMPMETTV